MSACTCPVPGFLGFLGVRAQECAAERENQPWQGSYPRFCLCSCHTLPDHRLPAKQRPAESVLARWSMLSMGGCPTTSPTAPCCNPKCQGNWGTGCPCCHFGACPGRMEKHGEIAALRDALRQAVTAIREIP